HYIRILTAVKDQTGAVGWFLENLSHAHYIPSFSPLRGQWWLLRHLANSDPDLDRDAPWKSVVPQPASFEDVWRRLRPDWWLLDWTQDGPDRSPKAGGCILFLLLGGTAYSGWMTRRRA